jgi:hypothetical protein
MSCCSRSSSLLGSFVKLSLLGLAVLVLIGPALAVGGVLLPFALIGVLAWGVYRGGAALRRGFRGRRSRLAVVEAPAPQPPSRLASFTRRAAYLFFEVGCGAALGAGLAVLADWQTSASVEHVLTGAGIGAVVAFVVGGTRAERARDEAEEGPAPASQAA